MSENNEQGNPPAIDPSQLPAQDPVVTINSPVRAPAPAAVAPAAAAAVAPAAPATSAAAAAAPQQDQKERPVLVGQTTSGTINLATPGAPENNDFDGLSLGPAENKGVTLTMDYTSTPVPLSERTDLNGQNEVMFFLSERGKKVDERIRAFVSPNSLRTGKGADWNESIVAAASRSVYVDRRFEASVNFDGSNYLQYLEAESGKLGFSAPKIAEAGAGGYTGEKGILRVRSIMGLGGIVSIPLWHSGFWITLTTPTESALIELQRRLQEEKIELGRETFGLVFSNEQSYINSWLLDFCFEHIYEHSVRVDSNQELRSLIKIQDLNILFWGLACLIWPRGFDYVRSLVTKEGIENTQTVSAKINLGKLMWVDNASFEPKHRAHMANRQRGKMTLDQVKDYQATFIPSLANGRRVEIKPGLEVLVASTDVDNYIADGEHWIAGIVQTVDSTFTQAAPNEAERNRMIETHARASRLRNNGAWVKSIIIEGNENTSREDIAEVLNVLSVDEEATRLVDEAINKFKDDSTRALIAIPETSGKEMGLPRFPHLIPIDVVNTFFTLLAQRVDIISRR
jgi:hypothetical protein